MFRQEERLEEKLRKSKVMIAKAAEAGHLEAVASETPEDIRKHLSDAMKKNRAEMRKLQELVVMAAGGFDDGGASSEDELAA